MKVFFGFILGFIFTMFFVGFDLAFDNNHNPIANFTKTLVNNLDGNLATNMAIAFATIIATGLALASHYSSKKNREWDIRKEPLLMLLKALTKSMELTQKSLNEAVAYEHGEGSITYGLPEEGRINIDSELNELLYIYKPLFPSKIIKNVEVYIQKDSFISYDYKHGSCSLVEAYRRLSDAQESLQQCLVNYLEEIARIKNT